MWKACVYNFTQSLRFRKHLVYTVTTGNPTPQGKFMARARAQKKRCIYRQRTLLYIRPKHVHTHTKWWHLSTDMDPCLCRERPIRFTWTLTHVSPFHRAKQCNAHAPFFGPRSIFPHYSRLKRSARPNFSRRWYGVWAAVRDRQTASICLCRFYLIVARWNELVNVRVYVCVSFKDESFIHISTTFNLHPLCFVYTIKS